MQLQRQALLLWGKRPLPIMTLQQMGTPRPALVPRRKKLRRKLRRGSRLVQPRYASVISTASPVVLPMTWAALLLRAATST